MTEATASDISTHYYKLAHLLSINCYIYSPSNSQLHTLLETEILIRHKYPEILISYYRNETQKCLYYFTFGHIDDLENNSGSDLENQYSTLKLTKSINISVQELTTPSKPFDSTGATDKDNFLVISSCFLKTIKKMIIYNLSIKKLIKIFGNHCLLQCGDLELSLLCIDPLLLPNGDLIVSMMIKNQPRLFDSSILGTNYKLIDTNHVIYIIPSGIRCHLFNPTSFASNIVSTIDAASQETLINLIKLSIGIDLLPNKITWIKLVPNLKHLNGSTSQISKFIHSVDNKKSILWPWELCCIQLGKFEDSPERATNFDSNPINLISKFLDFNIAENQSRLVQSVNLDNANATSVSSTKLESTEFALADPNHETPFTYDHSTHLFYDNVQNSPKVDNKVEKEAIIEPESRNDDMELDDLFGSDEGSDDNIMISSPKADIEPSENVEKPISNFSALDMDTSVHHIENEQVFSPDSKSLKSMSSTKTEMSKLSENCYIDIPRDQMTIRKSDTPIYADPGAPVPITLTPIIPNFLLPSVPSAPSSSAPEDYQPKSVFSPILFNPIIKSNIDTKYGKGGKFYVDKDSTQDKDLENKKRTMRATSVSGTEILNLKDASEQKGSILRDNIEEDEDSEYSSEESDADEEMEEFMSPLKIHSANEIIPLPQTSNVTFEDGSSQNILNTNSTEGKVKSVVDRDSLHFKAFGTSPNNSKFSAFRGESPNFSNDLTGSPLDFAQNNDQSIDLSNNQLPTLVESPAIPPQNKDVVSSLLESSQSTDTKGMTEYLSLILRGISVVTLPNEFLLNNHIHDKLVPNFSTIDVENENDLELTKSKGMTVKPKNINVLLKFLAPNLIFDLGLNNIKNGRFLYLNKLTEKVSEDSSSIGTEFQHIHSSFEAEFLDLFSNAYKIGLSELLVDSKQLENPNSMDTQLDFLDEITTEYNLLNPTKQYKKLKSIYWDSFVPKASEVSAVEYKEIISQLSFNNRSNEEFFFKLPPVKAKVMKNNEILNLNTVGLEFWKYLNFSPIKGHKDFQLIMVTEVDESGPSYATDFLNQLVSSYNETNLGTISRVCMGNGVDVNIENGLLLVRKEYGQLYTDVYNQIDKTLGMLIDSIKLDLIQKTKGFEFDKPLLILFANFNENLNSLLQISKIFRNFEEKLKSHQLPLVKIFTKILPSRFIVKKVGNESRLKVLSNIKVGKIAINLYNQCHNEFMNKDVTRTLITQLTREPPTKIQFKFMNNKDNNYNDDIFLHLAYERSIDGFWIAGAWSDPNGIVSHSKCWYVEDNALGSIIEDIWNICCDLFKRVNDEMKIVGGKKFLVLTRINSVIPELELFYWKKLSLKQKDISLIVLSTNRYPKRVFTKHKPVEALGNLDKIESSGIQSNLNLNGANLSPSMNFHSPQNYLSSGNIFSPIDIESEFTLHDPSRDIYGVIPGVQLPSFTSTNRSGSKIGYLMKECKGEQLVFEVCLLSCSSFWSSDTLLALILKHYNRLILLNDILGLRDLDGGIRREDSSMEYEGGGLIPWHIAAVGKAMEYLVHIYVE